MRNRWVTTKKAKEILEKLGPWLDKRPPLRKFTDRLDATVETIWPLPRIAALYVALDRAIARLRGPLSEASSCLVEMEVAATEPDMVPVVEQLKLDDVRHILGSVNDLELALTHVPDAFPGRANKRRRRPKLSDWQIGFVRDLAEVAEDIGIPVTTGGNPAAAEPHQTAFTTLVYEVERVLPEEMQSATLSACAKRIERAIRDSERWLGKSIAYTRKPQKRRSRLRDK